MTKKRKLSGSSPIKVEVKEENLLGNDYLIAKGPNQAKKRKTENMPTPYHHTYVMKLFDRSVDLARFQEDTPLYPICRAWMQNQPRNPQPDYQA
ncbi:hypothetical protein NQ317_008675 [Molorchus minor]|uniref:Uncharacterized protein n=1 Tax=Molorchus minor TaxID=1323400 RepID=A0ABQ9K040_9CUCU|nr:hypothetical protein NQ317_008675 [Molorchus minor]